METEEKISFLLEQMRLVLMLGDFTTLQILSKKILHKTLDPFPQKKIAWFKIMVSLSLHLSEFISCTHHLFMIFEELKNLGDSEREESRNIAMKIALSVVLAPYDNEQSDFLNRICLDESICEFLPYSYKDALSAFQRNVLITSEVFLEELSENTLGDEFSSRSLAIRDILRERIIEHV